MPSIGHFFVWNGAYRMSIKHTFRKTKIHDVMSKMKLIFRSQMEELYRFHGFVWVGCSFISTFYFMMKARGQFFEPFDQHYFDQHFVISKLNFPKKYGKMGQYWQKRVVWRFIHRIPVITNAQYGIFLFWETLIFTNSSRHSVSTLFFYTFFERYFGI